MSRAERRKQKSLLKNDFARFLKIIRKYFKDFAGLLSQVADPRKKNYYEIAEILMTVIMKNACSITSMQGMTMEFNDKEIVANLCKALGVEEKEFLPHYVTINECLANLKTTELEKLRKQMVYMLLRSRKFEDARFLKKYWTVIVDGTGLFYFNEKHCKHCLKKVTNKGTPEEKTYYYHNVLEAKIVLGEHFIISLGTEFIENENEDIKKQDCEIKAFYRLAKKIKKDFPRLPICFLADSLYAKEPVMEICADYDWHFLIRFKEGSIPTVWREYESICAMKEAKIYTKTENKECKRKTREMLKYGMKWVSDIDYRGYMLTVMELLIEIEKEDRTKEEKGFQWITDLTIKGKQAWEFAQVGRSRWLIENEGFNIQKNIRYDIEHANSLNYNAMKCHYLLTQIADIIMQLYEYHSPGIRDIYKTIKNISSELLKSLSRALTAEDIFFIEGNSYLTAP